MNPEPVFLLILGSGEIARCLASLAAHAGYSVSVNDTEVFAHAWPAGCELSDADYVQQPYALPSSSHAIIVRGHAGDPTSVACLLEHDASRVYLIASARRAQSVIEAVRGKLDNPSLLERLSAPAGLDLGGKASMEIALSILAEIQLRRYQASGKLLTDLREVKISSPPEKNDQHECPGKRV